MVSKVINTFRRWRYKRKLEKEIDYYTHLLIRHRREVSSDVNEIAQEVLTHLIKIRENELSMITVQELTNKHLKQYENRKLTNSHK